MKNASKLAHRLTRRAIDEGLADATWEELRDRVDSFTASDLDCVELDIMTDMVFSLMAKAVQPTSRMVYVEPAGVWQTVTD